MSLNIQMIRDSFEQAKPIADDVSNKFYEFLFTDYPAAKPLFENVNMTSQKKLLMASLSKIVDLLDQPEDLTKYLEAMGARHIKYGTTEDHYPLVGQTLIKTFAHFFGDAWTNELQSQWVMAYEFIAETMIKGANDVAPSDDDIKSKLQNLCYKLVENSLEDVFTDEIREKVRARVRREILNIIDEEFEEISGKIAA